MRLVMAILVLAVMIGCSTGVDSTENVNNTGNAVDDLDLDEIDKELDEIESELNLDEELENLEVGLE